MCRWSSCHFDGQYHAARQGTDERGCALRLCLARRWPPVLLLSISARGNRTTRGLVSCRTWCRGLRAPLLVVMDGAAGLVKAVNASGRTPIAALPSPQNAEHPREVAAADAGKDEGLVQQVFLAPVLRRR